MSRHKLVKNLDLDEELNDFDGYESEEGEQMSDEDREHLRIGTVAVRKEFPPSAAHITDFQIQEALWHYFFDVEKSVAYLIKTFVEKPKLKGKERENQKKESAVSVLSETGVPFSIRGFFHDTPWLHVPTNRLANLVAPIQSIGGLLGGSGEGPPKMSKLQALAAARKKKLQEQKSSEGTGMEKPMAGLNLHEESSAKRAPPSQSAVQEHTSRGFPIRKRKDLNPHEKTIQPPQPEPEPEPEPAGGISDVDQAAPSAFASAMFGSNSAPRHTSLFTLPYNATSALDATDPFAGPSPDDVVIAAQSQSKGVQAPKSPKRGGGKTPRTNKEMKADQIANAVAAIKIDDTPRAKSKNLDVLEEFGKVKSKNAANFVVIGHVDAGKSTLMGRLLYDLKVIDQRTIDRYRKEAGAIGKSSFALAWVLDQGSEERARGVTIDIATNVFETEKTVFTILDAPGHRDFVPNMIAGAAQADFAVLVIDASTGSFESGLKGQTKEHALLVRSLGVQRIIVAVNKLDSVDWSEERFTEIQQQMSAFLAAAGFKPKNTSFVPCSGLNGDNIARKSEDAAASWYKGSTLVEELENSEPVTRALEKPLRITVSNIFRGGVQNPLSISGRIEAGSLQMGDALLVQPASQKCFVKSLEVDNETVDWAVAGQNIVINLSGIEEQYLKIGDVISSPSSAIQNVKEFTVKVLAFEFLTPMAVDVHRGRLHAAGKIVDILGVLDKATGNPTGKKKPKIVKPGELARVRVELDESVPLETGFRVVLRSDGATVAAGLLE